MIFIGNHIECPCSMSYCHRILTNTTGDYQMWNQNTLTQKLNIDYPIIQGPFGGGLSSIKLLSAVSNAGGMGSYGAHILSPSQIYELTKRINETTDKAYALNLWVSDHDPGGWKMQKSAFTDYVKLFKPHYDHLAIEPPNFPEKYTEYFEEQVEALLDAKPPFSALFLEFQARIYWNNVEPKG